MPVDLGGEWEKVLASLQKTYGDDSVQKGGQFPSIQRVSTSSPTLDWAMGYGPDGVGGVPLDRWSRFYGPKGSCKSMVAWNVARNAMDLGMTVAYYNAEKAFDPDLLKHKGMDPDDVIIFNGTVIEELCTKLENSLVHIDLHIIDSCSACQTNKRLETPLEEKLRGDRAQAWFDGFEKAQERFRRGNAVIYIDQYRHNQGQFGGGHAPGGEFMEHQSSMTLLFQAGSWLYSDAKGRLTDKSEDGKSFSGQKEAGGREMKVRVEKSRVSRPFRSANLWLNYGEEGDDDYMEFALGHEYMEVGLFHNIIKKSGSFFTVPTHSKSIQGGPALREHIEGDEELQQLILDALP